MPFPKNTTEMEGWGYVHLNDANCKKCGTAISWWETPKGKKMPVNRGTAVPHWETCTDKESGPTGSVQRPQGQVISVLAWLSKNASTCDCVVCKKLTGR